MSLSQWTARALTASEKAEKYAQVRSLAAEEQRYRRDRWLAGWAVGGAGVVVGLLGLAAGTVRIATWTPSRAALRHSR